MRAVISLDSSAMSPIHQCFADTFDGNAFTGIKFGKSFTSDTAELPLRNIRRIALNLLTSRISSPTLRIF